MKPYRVEGGTVAIPAGELVGLSRAQVEGREQPADRFDRDVAAGRRMASPAPVERMQKRGEIFVCKTLAPLELAAGETVHLPTAPPQALADWLRPLGHEDGLQRSAPPAATPAVVEATAAGSGRGRGKK